MRAAAMCDGTIRSRIPERIRNHRQQEQAPDQLAPNNSEKEQWPRLAEVEGGYVARVLEKTGGNKQAASRMLGVDRKTLNRMIDRHHINFIRQNGRGSAG